MRELRDCHVTRQLPLDFLGTLAAILADLHPVVGVLDYDLPCRAIKRSCKGPVGIHARAVLARCRIVHLVGFLAGGDLAGFFERRNIDADGVAEDGQRTGLHTGLFRDKTLNRDQAVDILRPGLHSIMGAERRCERELAIEFPEERGNEAGSIGALRQIAGVVPQRDVSMPRLGLFFESMRGDFQRIHQRSIWTAKISAQTIAVGIAKISGLLRIENTTLVALKLLQTKPKLLQDVVGFLHGIFDNRLDVL